MYIIIRDFGHFYGSSYVAAPDGSRTPVRFFFSLFSFSVFVADKTTEFKQNISSFLQTYTGIGKTQGWTTAGPGSVIAVGRNPPPRVPGWGPAKLKGAEPKDGAADIN